MTGNTDAASKHGTLSGRLARSLRRILLPSSAGTNLDPESPEASLDPSPPEEVPQPPPLEPGPVDPVIRVAASPLFDGAWYLTRYPDIALTKTDPAHHYALFGEAEGRDAGPTFSAAVYIERHPEAVGSGLMLLHAEDHGQTDHGCPPPPSPEPVYLPDVDTLLRRRFADLCPLPVFAAPHAALRLSIVADRIDPNSLHHGVGTAIVMAAMTARRIGATLRIVTRVEPPDTADVAAVLDDHEIEWTGNMDFVHAPLDGAAGGVPAGSGDLFIVTSWSTAGATKLSVARSRIAYLMQEDERSLYPAGDDRLRCSETLRDPGIFYVAASETLLQLLQADGLAPGGTALASLPDTIERLSEDVPIAHERRRFLLCASPSIPGSLYWRGLEALSEAISSGVLDPAMWDFRLVGAGAHEFELPDGVRPTLLGNLPWADYVAEVRKTDLCLSLPNTPHPDTWLDLSACGAVVVTGHREAPDPLDRSRPSLVRSELGLMSLVDALREGARLAMERRCGNMAVDRSSLRREWDRAAASTVARLAEWAERAGR